MNIKPIKKENISDQVFEQLRNNIIDGIWKQGDKLPSENDLVEAFGVSRITIRQALSKLTTLGLIETRTGEGSFVTELKPGIFMNNMIPYIYLNQESLEELLEFRYVIEVETAGIAANKITDEDIERLEKSLKRMESNVDDLSKYVEEDLHFHMIIANSSKNSLIIQIHNIVRSIIKRSIKNLTENIGVENGLKYHKQIIEALKERDEVMVKNIMREHLYQAYNAYKDLQDDK